MSRQIIAFSIEGPTSGFIALREESVVLRVVNLSATGGDVTIRSRGTPGESATILEDSTIPLADHQGIDLAEIEVNVPQDTTLHVIA